MCVCVLFLLSSTHRSSTKMRAASTPPMVGSLSRTTTCAILLLYYAPWRTTYVRAPGKVCAFVDEVIGRSSQRKKDIFPSQQKASTTQGCRCCSQCSILAVCCFGNKNQPISPLVVTRGSICAWMMTTLWLVVTAKTTTAERGTEGGCVLQCNHTTFPYQRRTPCF